MTQAQVTITGITNDTGDVVTIAHQQKGSVEIQPGETLEGPFRYTYDPDKEGVIPTPNSVIFVGRHETVWGTIAFPTGEPS